MAKKDFGRRLMPEYLLKYSEELQKNHPDPSASWGGGSGGDYTAGYGIDITNDEISIDQEVVASKSELNGYIKDNDLNYSATFRGKGVWVKAEGAYTATSYGDGSIARSIPNQPGYTYDLPNKSGTVAMTSDIITSYNDLTDKPTIPTKTSDLQNDSGFITGVDWDDVENKPSFATVATTGDYDDLLNKPTIPTVPSVLSAFTNDVGYITGITSADVITALGYTPGTSNFSGDYDDLSDKPTIPDSTSDLINDSGFITGITSSMIINALGYTPGTSSFSGSYNDLTDKPTIPTKTSDLQNDSGFITGVTWNDVTGKPTFATVATSGSYNDLSDKPSIPSASDFVDLTSSQTITGYKTFSEKIKITDIFGARILEIKNDIHLTGFSCGGRNFELPLSKPASDPYGAPYTLATTDDIPTVPTKTSDLQNDSGFITSSALSGYATETWVGQQGFLTGITSAMITSALGYTPGTSNFSGSYTDLTDKPSIPSTASSTSTSTVTPTTETLVFTLSDNSTVNVTVMTGATVATTTTTTLS